MVAAISTVGQINYLGPTHGVSLLQQIRNWTRNVGPGFIVPFARRVRMLVVFLLLFGILARGRWFAILLVVIVIVTL